MKDRRKERKKKERKDNKTRTTQTQEKRVEEELWKNVLDLLVRSSRKSLSYSCIYHFKDISFLDL